MVFLAPNSNSNTKFSSKTLPLLLCIINPSFIEGLEVCHVSDKILHAVSIHEKTTQTNVKICGWMHVAKAEISNALFFRTVEYCFILQNVSCLVTALFGFRIIMCAIYCCNLMKSERLFVLQILWSNIFLEVIPERNVYDHKNGPIDNSVENEQSNSINDDELWYITFD